MIGMEEALGSAGQHGIAERLFDPLLHIGGTEAALHAKIDDEIDGNVSGGGHFEVIAGQAARVEVVQQVCARKAGVKPSAPRGSTPSVTVSQLPVQRKAAFARWMGRLPSGPVNSCAAV